MEQSAKTRPDGTLPFNPHVASLPAYNAGMNIAAARAVSGHHDIARLASNENPDGCSPKVMAALSSAAFEPWRYADDTIAGRKSEAQRSIGKLRSALFYARTDEVVRTGLSAFLLDVETRCRTIGDQMYAEFFSPRIMRPEEVVA